MDAQDQLIPSSGAASILRTLTDAGFEAFLVGGCVRDWCMGQTPKDWDIATSAHPEEVEMLFARTIPVGKAFGVMIVVREDGEYEVATFRNDGQYIDGRRPDTVTFSSAEEDVKRRDFTINALLYDPVEKGLIDYVGGLDDIKGKRIRTVGDPTKRFQEDHLRMLRAVRFAARTGYTIQDETLTIIQALAGLVRTVSPERTGQELTRMVAEGYAHTAFMLLDQTGLLVHTLPELLAMKGMPQPLKFHPEGDVWEHTMLMLRLLDDELQVCRPLSKDEQEALCWATILHDVGKPKTLSVSDRIRFHEHDTLGAEMAAEILRRLKRPNRIIDMVHDLIRRHITFAAFEKMRVAKRRRFLQEPTFPLHLALHWLDCMSSHRMLGPYTAACAAWHEEQQRPPPLQPLLTGRDLIAEGYPPGPSMGKILHALTDAQLEGEILTREAALRWLHEQYPA